MKHFFPFALSIMAPALAVDVALSGAPSMARESAGGQDSSDMANCWGSGCESRSEVEGRPLQVVSASCVASNSAEPECPEDDTLNAQGGLLPDREYIHYKAAQMGEKVYTYVFELPYPQVISKIFLMGLSDGYWCEDGLLGGDYCHNDNIFKFYQSDNGVDFWEFSITGGESCARLDDGCSITVVPTRLKYLKIEAASECDGCINDDYVDTIILSAAGTR